MAVLLAIGMSSCTESSEKQDKAISYKIESNEQLSEEDYGRMIDYVGEYAQKAQKYVDMQINGTDTQEATQGMQKLAEEYPLVDQFRNCIRQTPLEKLSASNQEKIGQYAGLIEFSAPAGYDIQTNAKAAGLEVATPETDNGVVAGAVDTLKVKR